MPGEEAPGRRAVTTAALAAALAGLLPRGPAVAQGAPPAPGRDLQLRGGRFAPLTWPQLTPEQKVMAEQMLAGPRGKMDGPYNVLLRSPRMGDLAQRFGAYTRFDSVPPRRLNELAILVVARHWTCQYEWLAHSDAALAAGLPPAVVKDLAAHRRPRGMAEDEAAVYAFTKELIVERRVSDATFHAARQHLGETGLVDLIGTIGYYQFVAAILNADGYPLPAGVPPPLR